MPYLDVIRRLKESSHLPISAYHVSGEYAMMKAAVERGWLDERAAVLEVRTSVGVRGCATGCLPVYVYSPPCRVSRWRLCVFRAGGLGTFAVDDFQAISVFVTRDAT